MTIRIVPPSPIPTPIPFTSPSTAAEMRRCMLRVAFSKSARHRSLVSRGPAARLGTACHAVLEAVGRGALDEVSEEEWDSHVRALWERAVQSQWDDARHSTADSELGPPVSWPYYYLRLAQLELITRELARGRRTDDVASTLALDGFVGASSQVRLGYEVSLEGFGGKLRGQADRVTVGPEGLCVDDYKTGAIYEHVEEPDHVASLKEDYRIQLLDYAALYHEETRIWPDSARVIPLHGEPVLVQVDPLEAERTAREAIVLFDRYNALASQGRADSLASPSPESCSTCSFRGPCDAYWANVAESWVPPDRPSTAGRATDVQQLGDGSVVVTVEGTQGAPYLGLVRIRGLTPQQISGVDGVLEKGANLRVVRLRGHQKPGPAELWAGAESEVWVTPF